MRLRLVLSVLLAGTKWTGVGFGGVCGMLSRICSGGGCLLYVFGVSCTLVLLRVVSDWLPEPWYLRVEPL